MRGLPVRLWFSPASEVPIYRQLVTQVVLAILSGDLSAGDRLPSTRELARRFSIHPNTVSAGYRQLEREGWTEYRHGSGVYVKNNAVRPSTPEQILDQHIAGFFRAVRELNLPAADVRRRVARWLESPPPDHFLLVDPDAEVREILLAELRQVVKMPVSSASIEDCAKAETLLAAIPVCRPSQANAVRAALPAGVELITLQIRSARAWLDSWLPSLKGGLIGVASRWPDFVEIARTVLEAAGVEPERLVLRNAARPRWVRGLDGTAAIICDALTAAGGKLPEGPRIFVFPFLADAAHAELSRFR
ncbi:GntR family transcriptional regulator [Occallatibacter riparius]|uniref:GntR family transcriptional regulator n=1 Tax=Occallatibacter riparius TaxID=1002689 RepID=A0A9J7BGD6_9BACT|nr:GntR family transcriptional regulator [Occallatibacter riparius]UWZ81848.1 GntR family transcriptional regulator [Occallatibacter riparius]